MRYGSVCSGIEAATAAWRPLGWECAFVSEIEPFASAVLAARLPGVPNLGDFTKIGREDIDGCIDLLVGGTPCQSYSIAGRGGGLRDPRGALALELVRLAGRSGARWLVWENVTGALASSGGGDFAAILSALCGWDVGVPPGGWRNSGVCTNAPGRYGVSWRVLDAQYTRVPEFPRALPQRRRRVVLVGSLGGWEGAAEVLLGGELRGGSSPPRRDARPGAAAGDGEGAEGGSFPIDVMNIGGRRGGIRARCYDDEGTAMYTLRAGHVGAVCTPHDLRRLMPVEAERLMGFPDGWTDVPWRGRPHAPGGLRHRALGNSMCVNVMAWVGRRIGGFERKERGYGPEEDRRGDGEAASPAEGGGG